MSKEWDVNKLLNKYPIKNIWEWKFTGRVITSTVCLHDIKQDILGIVISQKQKQTLP